MFKGITLKDFNKVFQSESKCRQYLFNLKWGAGYRCKRCGSEKYWKGRTSFHIRCTTCDYDESISAHTIFHKLQLPLLKAFSMVYHIVVFKKGISTMELAKIYGINQKTAWAFKRKVQEAMGAALSTEDDSFVLNRICSLDGIAISHRTKNKNGLQRIDLQIQKKENGHKQIDFVRCRSLLNPGQIHQCSLVAGRYVDVGKDIRMWNFKGWLTGVHHHCSEKFLNNYLDEFFFRLMFTHKQDLIFHSLLTSIVSTKPYNVNARAA